MNLLTGRQRVRQATNLDRRIDSDSTEGTLIMGWYNDDAPRHEGYLIGVRAATNERGSVVFRDLGTDDDERGDVPIRIVQVGCDCGWRSQRLRAPYGTTWNQLVQLPRNERDNDDQKLLGRQPFETVCRGLWREHALGSTDAGLEVVDE